MTPTPRKYQAKALKSYLYQGKQDIIIWDPSVMCCWVPCVLPTCVPSSRALLRPSVEPQDAAQSCQASGSVGRASGGLADCAASHVGRTLVAKGPREP